MKNNNDDREPWMRLNDDIPDKLKELQECRVESLYCFTHEKRVCFFVIKVHEHTSPYQFFLEDGFLCFFEEWTPLDLEEGIECYTERNEIYDIMEGFSLQDLVIKEIYLDVDVVSYKYIKLVIRFNNADTFLLRDIDDNTIVIFNGVEYEKFN